MARIPDTYQEVEYLRGTGTQYIRTSYFATGNTSIKIKFRVNELAGQGIFGSRDTTTPTNAYLMWGAGAGFWRAQYGSQNFVSEIERDTEWHTWEQRQNVCFLDNKLFHTFEKQSFQNTYEQLLFGIGGNTSTLSGLYVGKDDIGIVEYWENNELTMQLIPCYRKSDKTAGYYDTVFKEFLPNAGTGKFEVGPDVNKPELRMMYWKGERLPNEYQELEYIESTGTQYIDTGWFPKSTNLEVSFKIMALQSMATSSICGDENANYTNARWLFTLYGQRNDWQQYPLIGTWNNTSGSGYHISTPKNKIVSATIKYNNGVTTCLSSEGDNWTHTQPDDVITNHTGTLKLFQNTSTQKSAIRMYEYTIKDNGVLVRDFKPCYRKSDNVVGMFDTVGGKFYINSGTGVFKKGAYVSLPDEYQQLTYIESTGTQWLDTGYAFKSDKARLEIKFMNTADNNGKNICSSSAENAKSFGFYQYQSDALTSYNGTNMNNRTPIPVKDGIVNASIETFGINTQSTSIINGVSFTANQTATIISNVTFGLFTKHDSNQSYIGTRLVKARIYLCKLWDNNVLVRDLVPCYRKSDDVIGMFDLINATFYTNAGSGKFVKGSTKQDLRFFYAESNKLPNEYQEVEYIETPTNSKAYLITDYKQTQNTSLRIVAEGGGWIMGGRTVTPVQDGIGVLFNPSATYAMFGNQTNMVARSFDSGKHTVEIGSSGCFVDGEKITDYNQQEFQSQVPMWIFNINDKGLPNNSYFVGKIYSAQILENGQIVRNYVPSFRKSDNVIGMFETITKQFLTNAGTGTFTKGSYTSIPSEYQALEYLDTDNQYFGTLLNYEACTIEQVVKFEPDTKRRLIGWSRNNTRYWGADTSNRYETGPSNIIPADKALATEWHNVKFITDGKLTAPTATVLVDDKFSTTRIGTGSATLSTYDYLTDAHRCVAYFKFIKKILPDGTVKNNLRPCVRKLDNKVGWYDLITEQFLPNNCKVGQYKRTLRIIYM